MKKILLLLLLLVSGLLQQAQAQNRTVSGRVTDRATNEGLPGVTVIVKGQPSIGTSTNADGSFSLSGVPDGEAKLVMSYVGFTTQEIAVTNSNTVTISLATDTKQLNEVVVTALGIEKDKKTLGYATQTIDAGQLTQGRDRSVLNSLQGKVAGVQISSASGGVGSSTRIVIRGNKSFLNNNQPIYVVDGIPIGNDAIGTGDNLNNGVDTGNRSNDVNPDDVESVSILKGPAATALYGSRGANGAIIVTTKSGRGAAKRGKRAEVTYNTSYVIDDILFLPKFQNEFGQGYALQNPDTRENFSWGPRFDGRERTFGQIVGNQQRVQPYVALPNNVRDFFDLGKTFTNSISLGGGNETSNYILSASHTNQSGVTPGTKYDRTSVKIGGESKLTNHVTSSASATYTHSGGNPAVTGQGNNSVYNNVMQTPRNISLLDMRDLKNKFNTVSGYYGAYTVNPWQVLNDNQLSNQIDRLFGNAQIGYTFNDHFRINGRAGVDTYSDRRSQFSARRDAIGQNAPRNDDGFYREDQLSYNELTTDVIATYNTNITEDFTVSALVGQNFSQIRRNTTSLQADILVNNSIGANFANNGGTLVDPNSGDPTSDSQRRLLGVYSTVDFGFRDYLFLGLTARNDWSSTLPKGNSGFFYPAVNLGFVFTDLLKLQENPFFSYGKLRANYAQVGNDATVYQTTSTFGIANPTSGFNGVDLLFPIDGVSAYTQGNRIGSNTLQPELTKSLEVGAELRFLQNRLTIDATYYDARTTNQIIPVPISATSGFTSLVRNVGEVQNKGLELLVSGTPVKIGAFSWDLSLNYTKNVSKVLSIFDGTDEILIPGSPGGSSLVVRVGEPYGVFKASDIRRTADGRVVVSPSTGLPLSTLAPQYLGTITPDYTAGLSSTFGFKGASLTVVFDTKQGGKMFSRTRDVQRFVGTSPETLYNDRQPFIVPNSVNETGNFTSDGSPIYATNSQVVNPVDYWGQLPEGTNIIDASFTKIREVALGYSLPSKFLEKTPFGALSIGITGRNLFLWRAKENTYVDPETSNLGNGNLQGYDFSASPSLRSYGANLRVSF